MTRIYISCSVVSGGSGWNNYYICKGGCEEKKYKEQKVHIWRRLRMDARLNKPVTFNRETVFPLSLKHCLFKSLDYAICDMVT